MDLTLAHVCIVLPIDQCMDQLGRSAIAVNFVIFTKEKKKVRYGEVR